MSKFDSDSLPLLARYNNTYNDSYPLINADKLAHIRGSGEFNPAPLYEQTTDRGNAYINSFNMSKDKILYPPENVKKGELYITTPGAVQLEGSWDKNTNYELNTENDNYKNYDEYQVWALKTSRLIDPHLLPYLFSKINIKFIQDSVVNYIYQLRNIKINTKQDTENLLNLIMSHYLSYYNSNGVYIKNLNDEQCKFEIVLGNLNKSIIEQYVKQVLSGLSMYEYYEKDISNLPIPLTHPTYANNKGTKILGHVGYFENNHEFTKNINSFNARNNAPGKLFRIDFGN